MKIKTNKAKCRTQEGIVVGLIDSLISVCRILPSEMKKAEKENGGELTDSIVHALQDLTQDEDVLHVLRAVSSRYIISEERAKIFDAIIDKARVEKLK